MHAILQSTDTLQRFSHNIIEISQNILNNFLTIQPSECHN